MLITINNRADGWCLTILAALLVSTLVAMQAGAQNQPPAAQSGSGALLTDSADEARFQQAISKPPRSDRLPAPAAPELANSQKLMRDLFAARYADKSVKGRQAFAGQLMETALGTNNDPAGRYALLQEARDIAMASGEFHVALEASLNLGDGYNVSTLDLVRDAVAKLGAQKANPDESSEVSAIALALVEADAARGSFGSAQKLIPVARSAAGASRNQPLIAAVRDRLTRVEQRAAEYDRAQVAFTKLKTTPDDPDANLAAGRYCCFERDDFETGLSCLVKGQDANLKSIAAAELAKPTTAALQKAAGDLWFDQIARETKSPSAADKCKARASYWYNAALPSATGLLKITIERRLAVLTAPDPHGSPAAATARVGEIAHFDHQGGACGIVFTPDGKYVISSGNDKMIRMWELSSGREVRTFAGHTDRVGTLSISASGKVLASASYDKTARAWNVETGQQVAMFKHGREVEGIALSRDGGFLIAGDFGGRAVMYDLAKGTKVPGFNSEGGYAAAFSDKNHYVLAGGWDHVNHVWDLRRGFTEIFKAHNPDQIKAAAFTFDETKLISAGGGDTSIHLWDLASGAELRTFAGHTDRIRSVACCPGDRMFVSGAHDGTVRVWNLQTGKELANFVHQGKVWGVAVSPDGRLAASAGDDGVRIWGLPKLK